MTNRKTIFSRHSEAFNYGCASPRTTAKIVTSHALCLTMCVHNIWVNRDWNWLGSLRRDSETILTRECERIFGEWKNCAQSERGDSSMPTNMSKQ